MISMIGVHHKDTKSQDQVFLLPLCPHVFVVGFGVQRDVFDSRIHFPAVASGDPVATATGSVLVSENKNLT
jgi:hypothetical protein